MSFTNKTRPIKKVAELLQVDSLPKDVASIELHGLTLDSREISAGDLFIAIKGRASDGRAYVELAIESGAVCVFRQGEVSALNYVRGVAVIDIVDLPKRVSALAAEFYDWPAKKMTTVAVTGTNGKTSCVVLLCDLLQKLGKRTGLIGTLGYGLWGEKFKDTGLTTPDPVACQRMLAELCEAGAEFVALEASSHAIEQYRIESIEFNGLIFTNLSRDHLDYHGDFASYQAAKLRMFEFPGVDFFVTNADSETGNEVLSIAKRRHVECVSYGFENSADVMAHNASFSLTGITASLQTPWGREEIHSHLIAPFNLSNLLAVVSSAVMLGYSLQKVLREIPKLSTVNGRMQKISISEEQGLHVFLDYAHTPDALEKSIESIPPREENNLWVIFGCGGDRDKGKRPMMGKIAVNRAEKVVVTSDNPRSENPEGIVKDIVLGVTAEQQHKVKCIVERDVAISQTIALAGDDDIILVAGKGHEDYQVIGSEKLFFDDAAIIKDCLRQRYASTGALK